MRLSNLFKKVLPGKPAACQNSIRRRKLVPELEALEDRQLLSSYSVGAGPNVWGKALHIWGDIQYGASSQATDDIVAITDNGTGSPGNITFTLNGVTTTIGDYISCIKVETGGGKDNVTYTLTGDLQRNVQRAVWVDLGRGDDNFHAYAHHDLLGRDIFTRLDYAPTLLDIEVAGGKGRDTLTMSAYGNTGIKIHRNAMLNVLLDGGKGDHDLVTTNVIGELDGYLGLGLSGGKGNDTVTASLTLQAGSIGKVDAPVKLNNGSPSADTVMLEAMLQNLPQYNPHGAYVAGRSGDDDLSFRIYNYGTAHINAEIVGGTGHDSMHCTSNVRKF